MGAVHCTAQSLSENRKSNLEKSPIQ